MNITQTAQRAKAASRVLARSTTQAKNGAILRIAERLSVPTTQGALA